MTEEEKIGFTTALEVAKQAIAKMPYAMSEEIEEGHEQAYRAIQALTDSDPVSVQEAAIIVADAIDADMFTASRIASEVGKTLENETPVSHWLSTILRSLAEQSD